MTKEDHAPSTTLTVDSIKTEIKKFLYERLENRLKTLSDDDNEQRSKLLAAYEPQTWISDEAQRVVHLQQATHAIKFTHPKITNATRYALPQIMKITS